MRFRTLELLRYGGYADRRLDFGSASPDLHLIVGPNEAGKSTLLAAIGDLLFGFPAQSAQNWRFDYADLRIRAVIEQGTETLDIVRRKGMRNTLLGPDGGVLADAVLAPLLGATDRAAFERMFGLDHAKLRAGGKAIVEGRDDLARTLFEAGSGFAEAGRELKALDEETEALFKPSGSKPVINELMAQRQALLRRVREETLGDAALSELERRRDAALSRRTALIAEAEAVAGETARVERVLRTRAPLARLAAARARLAEIGPVPDLHRDATERLARARAERATAGELAAKARQALDQAEAERDAIRLPAEVLAEQARIEALEERRPTIDKARQDLARRQDERLTLTERLAAARAEAELAADRPLPGDGWRRRAQRQLETARTLDARRRKHERDSAELAGDRAALAEVLAAHPPVPDLAPLRAAILESPADGEAEIRTAVDEARRRRARAEAGRAALPWAGSVQALAATVLPASEDVAALVRELDRAGEDRRLALKDVEAAEREIAEQRRRLQQAAAGEDLPTPDVIRAARAARDAALDDLRARFAGPRAPDDGAAGEQLARMIAAADQLADRRDGAAARIAEHLLASAMLSEAEARRQSALRSAERWSEQQAAAASRWARLGAAAGVPDGLPPSAFEAWRAARERVLAESAEADAAEAAIGQRAGRLDVARRRLAAALDAVGEAAPESYGACLAEARQVLERLEASELQRARAMARAEEIARRERGLMAEAAALAESQAESAAVEAALLDEAGIAPAPGALDRALEALEPAAPAALQVAAFDRQIAGMTRDIAQFVADAGALFSALGRSLPPEPSQAIRALAVELRASLQGRDRLERLQGEARRAAESLAEAERRAARATAEIAALMAQAGVADEAALDAVLEAATAAAAERARDSEARRELTDGGDGLTLEALTAESDALPPAEAAAARASLADRRRSLEAEREAVGRELAEVLGELERAARRTEAAEAQQAVAEVDVALSVQAERFAERAAARALMRWLLDRYRASRQAPLLARAGALFATVTGGAYRGLKVDYDDDDTAMIVAERPDGKTVGVKGLSEGTLDQLYLALRLGALAELPAGTALPLVCDDLLITADDQRAAAMLRILHQAARSMQVLVFTHHDHLVEVARGALGEAGLAVHRLEPVFA